MSFHIIQRGTGTVGVHGVTRPRLGPGDGFGEIALLRHVPRTATITATEPLTTLTLCQADFPAAVGGNRVSADQADRLAAQRLAGDPTPEDPDG